MFFSLAVAVAIFTSPFTRVRWIGLAWCKERVFGLDCLAFSLFFIRKYRYDLWFLWLALDD